MLERSRRGFPRGQTFGAFDGEGESAWLSFVRVEDVSATVEKARELGANIYLEPTKEVVDGKMAIIEDVVGAKIVVLKYEPEEEK